MINLRVNMIAHVFVLLYTLVFTFKNIISVNDKIVKKLFAFCTFISALWLITHRDTYLPFLGYCAVPPSIIKDVINPPDSNVDISLHIDAKDGTRVIYWGAKPNGQIQKTPQIAYGEYSNAGISIVKDGIAKIRIQCPAQYKVGPGYLLKRHIHYRLVLENGLLTPIETKYVSC